MKYPTPTTKEIQAVWGEVFDESDRGCVLLCAALLDRSLERLLRLRFRSLSAASDEEIDKALVDHPAATLLSFTARARVAHLIGIFPPAMSDSLRQLARIRNVFAHRDVVPALSIDVVQPVLDSMMPEARSLASAFEKLVMLVKDLSLTSGKLRMIAATTALHLVMKAAEENAKNKKLLPRWAKLGKTVRRKSRRKAEG